MATRKSSERRSRAVEEQKGPISMDEQYTMAFMREPERTMQDLQNMAERRAGMTLTKHEPKR